MLYEFLHTIEWLVWFDRIVGAVIMSIFLFVIIWTLPIFINKVLIIAQMHQFLRQGTIMLTRLTLAFCAIFIVSDILGFGSDSVFTILSTVVGVGISWAIKDQVANVFAGLSLFVFRDFGIGDSINSDDRFCGSVQCFGMQHVIVRKKGSPSILTYIPNQIFFSTVIDVEHQPIDTPTTIPIPIQNK